MPLPSPILDDRSYQQLRDELIRRIPVYAPEWTDRNPSDPGITLIELFAFLGENLLYRFNQIPDATTVLRDALSNHDAEFTRAEAGLRVDLVVAHARVGEFAAARNELAAARRTADAVGSARQLRRLDRVAATIA